MNADLESFVHAGCSDLQYKKFLHSSTDSASLKEVLIERGYQKTDYSDFIDPRKSITVKRLYTMCQMRIDELMTRLTMPVNRFEIGFCFVNSDQPNASAVLVPGDKYAILISDAIIPMLFNFWWRSLKRGSWELSIEEVSQSDRKADICPENLDELWRMIAVSGKALPGEVFHLWECIRFSMEFIIDHEFAHIVYKHLIICRDLKIGMTGSAIAITEAQSGPGRLGVQEARVKQVFELDADRLAADFAIRSFLGRHRLAQTAAPTDPARLFYLDMRHAFEAFYISLYLIFRLFGAYSDQISNMHYSGHPPTFMRLINMYGIFISRLDYFKIPVGQFDRSIDPKFCEVVYCGVTGAMFDASLRDFWLTDECQAYLVSLAKDLEKLISGREELEKAHSR